ncbi:MAG TPA: helix-turn-helix domain-containing protein [Firmicutes bacterium]|nr:helix-turn-helix domain-containing protein [Bacillota bacterium]
MMKIGENIRNARRRQDMTQEQLAEYLNLSVSAVSQWESGRTMPDIALLPALTQMLGVSADELLGIDAERTKQEIDAYVSKSARLWRVGDVNGVLRLWREAVQCYPKNFTCLCNLAHVLLGTLYRDEFAASQADNAAECAALCERILRDCSDPEIRSSVLQTAVYLYANRNAPVADEQKAEAYAKMLPSLYCSRELLLADAYTTEEGREKALVTRHCLTLDLTDLLCRNLPHLRREDVSTENDILAQETALKVWNAVICDGNFLFYHCRIADIYRQLACDYAALGGREETLRCIRLAFAHADAFDGLPEAGDKRPYTAPWVAAAVFDSADTGRNYTEAYRELVRRTLERPCFDFLRGDPEFDTLSG